jgi:hypothetical protein
MKIGVALGQFWPFRRRVSDMDSSDDDGMLARPDAAPRMDSAPQRPRRRGTTHDVLDSGRTNRPRLAAQ